MGIVNPAIAQGRRPFLLPLSFLGTGVLSFVAFNLFFLIWLDWIAAGYFRNPYTLVVTHLYTLGFVTAIILGAMYQLVPVILENPLWSNRLGLVHLGLFLTGYAALLYGFPGLNWLWLTAGGTLQLTGTLLFVINMAQTMRGARYWHMAGTFLVASLAYLALLVTWGLLLALNMRFGYLGGNTHWQLLAHVGLGFLGWFTNTIIGVAYRLVPLFTLSHAQPGPLSRGVLVLLNLGVLGVSLGAMFSLPAVWLALFLAAVLGAVLLFALDLRRILLSRARRSLDLSVRYLLGAFAALLAALGVSLWLLAAPGPVTPAQAVAALYLGGAGWVGLMVVGHMYKIVPFLVWTARYAGLAGREAVPTLREMFSERAAYAAYLTLAIGVLGVTAGLLGSWPVAARAGAALALLGALIFAYGMYTIYQRLWT